MAWEDNVGEIFYLLPTKFTEPCHMLVKVTQQAPTVKPSAQHSGDHHTFVHLVVGDRPAPHWMGSAEEHKVWFKVFQGFFLQLDTVGSQFCLPKVSDICFTESFEGLLGWWLL